MSFWETVVVRNWNSTIVVDPTFHETATSHVFHLIQTFGSGVFVICSLSFALYVVFFKRHVSRAPAQLYVLKLLFLHILCVLITNLTIFILSIIEVPYEHFNLCNILAPLVPFFQVLSYGVANLIFLQRSKVGTGSLEKTSVLKISSFVAKWGTIGGIAFAWVLMLIMHGRLFPNLTCTYIAILPWWVTIIFTMATTNTYIAFLLLFLIPVYKNLLLFQNASENQSFYHLRQAARKNLKWSTIAIVSSFVFLVIVTIYEYLKKVDSYSYSYYLLNWTLTPVDSGVNLFCLIKITESAWRGKSRTVLSKVASSNYSNPRTSGKNEILP